MHITAKQVDQMRQYTEEAFIRRIAQFISDYLPVEADRPTLRPDCERLVQRARVYGFSSELEVATFIACGFAFGMDFDAHTRLPFRQILNDEDYDCEGKAEKLGKILDDRAVLADRSGKS